MSEPPISSLEPRFEGCRGGAGVEPGCLVLVGYRGTGKSTVGRLLADRLNWPFVDLDEELQARLRRTIAEMFAAWGEVGFRDEEQRLLDTFAGARGRVIATGGGVVLREANRRSLRDLGLVVWLQAEPDTLVERIRSDPRNDRPALTAAGTLSEVAPVLESREPLYREVADLIVPTAGRDPNTVASAILEAIGGSLGSAARASRPGRVSHEDGEPA